MICSGALLQVGPSAAEEAETITGLKDGYILDPVISGDSAAPYKPETPSKLIIDQRSNETRLQLETTGQVAPYIGTGRREPPSKGVLHLLNEEERTRHRTPHLETGIGVNLTESTNFNLGYRMESSPLDFEEDRQDNGQVRFGIDFRFPSQ
jgi:hypothetical protein